VLVVDDDARVRRMLAEYLVEQGLRVTGAASGVEMHAAFACGPVDVVLLDLVLPGEDGLALAGELRAKSDVAIIILTGRGDVVDRVVGLEVGADDYLAKPFHLREVLARIKSVLRRTRSNPRATTAKAAPAPEAAGALAFAGFALDPAKRRLTAPGGEEVALTTGEFNLLLAFAEHPGRVLDRDTLMDLAKGRQWEALDRSVDTQVARLRRKIEPDPKNPTLIRSVRGVGYLFAADVTRG
jgi:DNA-binding response OmpR family regulator